jgi:hypothetical protein
LKPLPLDAVSIASFSDLSKSIVSAIESSFLHEETTMVKRRENKIVEQIDFFIGLKYQLVEQNYKRQLHAELIFIIDHGNKSGTYDAP